MNSLLDVQFLLYDRCQSEMVMPTTFLHEQWLLHVLLGYMFDVES
jgi:hypothetical protein